MVMSARRRSVGVTNEQWTYYDPIGTRFELSSYPRKLVLSEKGTGMPEINYVTQRGPFQHGTTPRSFFLEPRVVELEIRQNGCTRDDYWSLRDDLIGAVRPNKWTDSDAPLGRLRKRRYDGGLREIEALVKEGPGFDTEGGVWDQFGYTETIQFIAFNPIWYDPSQHTVSITPTAVGTFPMTFPVTFLSYEGSATIAYAGNWDEYPTIVITGPFKNPVITNETTGETIALNYTVPADFDATITLTYSQKTIILSDGTNLIGYMATNSDLAAFHLTPGDNEITVRGDNGAGETRVVFTYYDRYLGV